MDSPYLNGTRSNTPALSPFCFRAEYGQLPDVFADVSGETTPFLSINNTESAYTDTPDTSCIDQRMLDSAFASKKFVDKFGDQTYTETPFIDTPAMSPFAFPVTPSQLLLLNQSLQGTMIASPHQHSNPLGHGSMPFIQDKNTPFESQTSNPSEYQQRRSMHKDAEQKRRDTLKNCFDILKRTLRVPEDVPYSKVALMHRACQIIDDLRRERDGLLQSHGQLLRRIEMLEGTSGSICGIPSTTAPNSNLGQSSSSNAP